MRLRSLLSLAPALLALTAAGCDTSPEGVSINISAALRAYRERLDRKPGRAQTERILAALKPEQLNDLGVAYQREGRLQDAEWAFRQAIRNNVWYVTPHINLANVLREQGRTQEALDRYRKALLLDPHSFEAANNFADLCARERTNIPEAMAILSPLLDTAGALRPYGLDTLGWLQHLSGQHPRAAETLQAALREAPAGDLRLRLAIHEHLAQVCLSLERHAEAAEHNTQAGRLRSLIESRGEANQNSQSTRKGGEPRGREIQ